jgi:hypothetical protein
LDAVRAHPSLDADDERWLSGFFTDADLVIFARLDRLAADAREQAESARQWVRRSTRREADRQRAAAARALASPGAESPSRPAIPPPGMDRPPSADPSPAPSTSADEAARSVAVRGEERP